MVFYIFVSIAVEDETTSSCCFFCTLIMIIIMGSSSSWWHHHVMSCWLLQPHSRRIAAAQEKGRCNKSAQETNIAVYKLSLASIDVYLHLFWFLFIVSPQRDTSRRIIMTQEEILKNEFNNTINKYDISCIELLLFHRILLFHRLLHSIDSLTRVHRLQFFLCTYCQMITSYEIFLFWFSLHLTME